MKDASKSVVLYQGMGYVLFFEVPQDAFGKAGNCGIDLAGEFHSDIIAGQHHFIYLLVPLRLVFLAPT